MGRLWGKSRFNGGHGWCRCLDPGAWHLDFADGPSLLVSQLAGLAAASTPPASDYTCPARAALLERSVEQSPHDVVQRAGAQLCAILWHGECCQMLMTS